MIVIFNITALVAVLGTAAVAWLVYWFFPEGWLSKGTENIIFLVLLTLISGFMEAIKLRPRLFWVPVSIWSTLLLAYVSYDDYGAMGLSVLALSSGLLIASVIYGAMRLDKRNWVLAQQLFAEMQHLPADPTQKSLWKTLEECLYDPYISRYTSPKVCEHNLKVATLAGSMVTPEEYEAFVAGYKTVIAKGLEPERKKFKMSSAQTQRLRHLLKQKSKNPLAVAQRAVEE